MKDLLVNLGYRFDHSCNCGGFYNEIYNKSKKDSVQIWIRPNQDNFIFKRDGAVFKRGQSGSLRQALEGITQFV